MFIQFGISALLFRPNTTYGNNSTPSGPSQMLTLQGVGATFTGQLVELKGQYQYCDDLAIGDKTLKGDAEFGRFDSFGLAAAFTGDTLTIAKTTATVVALNELHAIPATPFQVVGTNTTAVADLGVFNAATMQPFTPVASSPAAGQYSVAISTGTITYTFASADNVSGISVLLSYSYTATLDSLALNNHPMGYGPICELFLPMNYSCPVNGTSSPKNLLHIFNVRFGDWGMPMKRDGHMISKASWQAFPSPSGVLAELITNDA